MQFLPDSEQAIISAVLNDASKLGLLVSVFDGEEWVLKSSPDYSTVQALVGATDETKLRFRDPDNLDADGKPASVGFVQFIHGNGVDVIGDFSDAPAMRALLVSALMIADILAAQP